MLKMHKILSQKNKRKLRTEHKNYYEVSKTFLNNLIKCILYLRNG